MIALSDLVVLSTNWEGLPLTPLEVGAGRKPIVASNVDGVRETIIDGKTGFLFKAGSAEDLAEKILRLYKSKNLREGIGKNAFNFVTENFNSNRIIKEYESLYFEIIEIV